MATAQAEKPATKTFANDPDDVSDYDSEDDYSDDDTQQKPQQQQQQQQQQRRRRRPQQQNPNDEDDTYYSDEYSDDYDDYDDEDDDYYDDEEEEVQAMERYQPTTISSRDNVPAQPIANGGMQEAEGKTGDDWEDQDGMKLKLELNLDIEVELKAHIHGDLTLSLLVSTFGFYLIFSCLAYKKRYLWTLTNSTLSTTSPLFIRYNPVIGRNSQMVSWYCEVVVKRFFTSNIFGEGGYSLAIRYTLVACSSSTHIREP
ncbi:uncharacterized protein BO96DRAFT_469659 [Aspergillus niger CBS 101883]|uniref:Contig An01c0080, genomic contig n=4 Tax=Aspergillus niger TaxID=5061 RepID=A2Q857_ASPNC|nr:uncharacterized protein BO96DRAFT_469659 [Aspergillus niger CBS 101883]XP_059603146.1 uncharacterized protein An01g03140 [Aspergillus niger]PYH52005.1 hypothetical protein BO96DRAFT_469659 [Aspergillus niger CBS 101883]CAK43680.1 unnamed protein product [Aspergillus niger]